MQKKVDLKVLGINKSFTYFKAYLHLCGVLLLISSLRRASFSFCFALLLLRIIKLETPEGIISFRNLSKVPVAARWLWNCLGSHLHQGLPYKFSGPLVKATSCGFPLK